MIATSSSSPGDGAKVFDVGIWGFAVKPCPGELLASILARVLLGPPEHLITKTSLRAESSPQANTCLKNKDQPLVGLRILMAEDNRINQQVAELQLEQMGAAEIRIAEDGAAAVAAVARSRPDLLLMDIQMPGMDGFEATEVIRATESREGLPRLPIIALTANAMQGDRERCLAADMDGYASKPLRPDDLRKAVASCLPRSVAPNRAPEEPAAQAQATGTAPAMITPETLEELQDLMGPKCARLYQEALNQIESQLAAIEKAHKTEDCSAIVAAAHALKGAAANLGLEPLAAAANTVEKAAREDRCATLDELTQVACDTAAAIRQAFP
jgi:CheY-like chemotaxis protein